MTEETGVSVPGPEESNMTDVDIVIIGGGIAGTSAAFELANDFKVMVLEMESHPGYHSTGRSAALFTEYYGNALVRKLARLSKPFLQSPPEGFTEYSLLKDRGVLFLVRADQNEKMESEIRTINAGGGKVEELQERDLFSLFPALKPGYAIAGIYDPHSMDIDVHALHQGFLQSIRKRGGILQTGLKVTELLSTREGWLVKAENEEFSCKLIVNAAGAWGEAVGAMARAKKIGLVPKKRTAFLFKPPDRYQIEKWPMINDIGEQFYFKPDSGKLLASPADETPVAPHDARPDDLDIATGIERIHEAVNFHIRHVSHKWAGLRSFVQDRTPVLGFDPHVRNFFWLVGQGGYGIKTSPIMAVCCANLIRDHCFPQHVLEAGVSEAMLTPGRL